MHSMGLEHVYMDGCVFGSIVRKRLVPPSTVVSPSEGRSVPAVSLSDNGGRGCAAFCIASHMHSTESILTAPRKPAMSLKSGLRHRSRPVFDISSVIFTGVPFLWPSTSETSLYPRDQVHPNRLGPKNTIRLVSPFLRLSKRSFPAAARSEEGRDAKRVSRSP